MTRRPAPFPGDDAERDAGSRRGDEGMNVKNCRKSRAVQAGSGPFPEPVRRQNRQTVSDRRRSSTNAGTGTGPCTVRIEMLKRQMFGRAGFALLRKRVLLAA